MADNLFNNLMVSTEVTGGQNMIPVGNTFVLNQGGAIGGGICKSLIGFRSVLISSTVLNADADPDYPFSSALDYRDNTQYSPLSDSGTVTIEFRQAEDTEISYMGISIHNGKTANLTGRLELLINGSWVNVANFAPAADLKTICEYFDPQLCQRQRLVLNFDSKLFIGCIYIGRAWEFSRLPNEGFTPADSNNIDEVVGFKSNSGQVIISRRKQVGYAQSGEFDFISFDDVQSEYIDYMNHVKDGKPFFMKWDVGLNQNIFGQHASPNNMQPPTYTSANTCTFAFDMVGYN
jgi:hypothetical protein